MNDDLRFAELPLLFGDGKHDDTAGVQALIDGKPARCAQCMTVLTGGTNAHRCQPAT